MENKLPKQLNDFLRKELLESRFSRNITQEQMAKMLNISTRAFSNLEGGHSTFSLITFLIYYAKFVDNKSEFMNTIVKIINDEDKSSK